MVLPSRPSFPPRDHCVGETEAHQQPRCPGPAGLLDERQPATRDPQSQAHRSDGHGGKNMSQPASQGDGQRVRFSDQPRVLESRTKGMLWSTPTAVCKMPRVVAETSRIAKGSFIAAIGLKLSPSFNRVSRAPERQPPRTKGMGGAPRVTRYAALPPRRPARCRAFSSVSTGRTIAPPSRATLAAHRESSHD